MSLILSKSGQGDGETAQTVNCMLGKHGDLLSRDSQHHLQGQVWWRVWVVSVLRRWGGFTDQCVPASQRDPVFVSKHKTLTEKDTWLDLWPSHVQEHTCALCVLIGVYPTYPWSSHDISRSSVANHFSIFHCEKLTDDDDNENNSIAEWRNECEI